jgi:hypothetical protein
MLSSGRASAIPVRIDATACAVESHGVVRVPIEEIASLRTKSSWFNGRKLPASLLKHADYQTVLSIAAVSRAIDEVGWQTKSFDEWGVLAAPRFLGRLNAAGAIERYRQSGVTGISPLLVATLTLHAVAGSLSLALQSHGFNYGIGGGHGHLAEVLLAGLAAREDNGVAGVWVVASQFSPEPVPDASEQSSRVSVGHAVALALSAEGANRSRLNLRVVSTGPRFDEETDVTGAGSPSGLVALGDFLNERSPGPMTRHWYCPLSGGGAIELEDDAARGVVASTDRAGSRAG